MRMDYEFYSTDPYEIPSTDELNNDTIYFPSATMVGDMYRHIHRYRTVSDDEIDRLTREWLAIARALQRRR